MLVLSRKRGEQILIGDDIVVTVVQCVGQRIKIGIEAPPHVRVMRSELTMDAEQKRPTRRELVFSGVGLMEEMLVGAPLAGNAS